MDFQQSRTKANLMAAFAGESQARNKYTFYAAKARQEGYEQIGDIFIETAENEREHAELWLKAIHGGSLPTTRQNLEDAAGGEQAGQRSGEGGAHRSTRSSSGRRPSHSMSR